MVGGTIVNNCWLVVKNLTTADFIDEPIHLNNNNLIIMENTITIKYATTCLSVMHNSFNQIQKAIFCQFLWQSFKHELQKVLFIYTRNPHRMAANGN